MGRVIFREIRFLGGSGITEAKKKERQKRNYFVTRSHLSESELGLAVVTRSEQLELTPPRVTPSYIRNSFSLETLYLRIHTCKTDSFDLHRFLHFKLQVMATRQAYKV